MKPTTPSTVKSEAVEGHVHKTTSKKSVSLIAQKQAISGQHHLPRELIDQTFAFAVDNVDPRVVSVKITRRGNGHPMLNPTSPYPAAFVADSRSWNRALEQFTYKETQYHRDTSQRPLLLNPQNDILWLTNFHKRFIDTSMLPRYGEENLFSDGPPVKRMAIPYSTFAGFYVPQLLGLLHQKGVQKLFLLLGQDDSVSETEAVFVHPLSPPSRYFVNNNDPLMQRNTDRLMAGSEDKWQAFESATWDNTREELLVHLSTYLVPRSNNPNAGQDISCLDVNYRNPQIMEHVRRFQPNWSCWYMSFLEEWFFETSLKELDIVVCKAISKKKYDKRPDLYKRVDVGYEWRYYE